MNRISDINVLIVDDQLNWQRALYDILEPEGYSISVASSLSGAECYLESKIFQLVLVDVRLVDDYPYGAQGLDVLKIAKQKGSSAIILTGYTMPGLADKAKELGADHFVEKEKNFDIEFFRNIVASLIRQ